GPFFKIGLDADFGVGASNPFSKSVLRAELLLEARRGQRLLRLALEQLRHQIGKAGRRRQYDIRLEFEIGKPDSAMVGSSGASGERVPVDTASPFNRPARTCGSTPAEPTNPNLIWPAARSIPNCVLPRYGTCMASKPAMRRKYSMHRWPGVPGPPWA